MLVNVTSVYFASCTNNTTPTPLFFQPQKHFKLAAIMSTIYQCKQITTTVKTDMINRLLVPEGFKALNTDLQCQVMRKVKRLILMVVKVLGSAGSDKPREEHLESFAEVAGHIVSSYPLHIRLSLIR